MTAGGYVYEIYDAQQRPIYAGAAVSMERRLEQHRDFSWWADQVDDIWTTAYSTFPAALAAEPAVIRRLHPRWNVKYQAPLMEWTERGHFHDHIVARSYVNQRWAEGRTNDISRMKARYLQLFGEELEIPDGSRFQFTPKPRLAVIDAALEAAPVRSRYSAQTFALSLFPQGNKIWQRGDIERLRRASNGPQ